MRKRERRIVKLDRSLPVKETFKISLFLYY